MSVPVTISAPFTSRPSGTRLLWRKLPYDAAVAERAWAVEGGALLSRPTRALLFALLTVAAVCGLLGSVAFDAGQRQAHSVESETAATSATVDHSTDGHCSLGCGLDHLVDAADRLSAIPAAGTALAPAPEDARSWAGVVYRVPFDAAGRREARAFTVTELSISRT